MAEKAMNGKTNKRVDVDDEQEEEVMERIRENRTKRAQDGGHNADTVDESEESEVEDINEQEDIPNNSNETSQLRARNTAADEEYEFLVQEENES